MAKNEMRLASEMERIDFERVFVNRYMHDILSDYNIFNKVDFEIVDFMENAMEEADDMFEYHICWEIKQAMWGWNSN